MKRLGQFLIELGWISPKHLARALQSQQVLGGRLGTCLLEMDALSEEHLLKALSHQLGVDATRPRDLRNIPPQVHHLLPGKLARRHQAIPFRMLGGELFVAMLDVHNLALHDELAFATGKEVQAFIAHEVRLFEALDQYYGFEAPVRYHQLLKRLNANGDAPLTSVTRDNADEPSVLARLSGAARSTPADPDPTPQQPAAAEEPADPGDEPRPTETADERQEASDSSEEAQPDAEGYDTHGVPEEAADGGTDRELLASLHQASDREDVAHRVLEYLGGRFETVALFKTRPEDVRGWAGKGPSLDQERLLELELTFDRPSVFLNLRQGGLFFAGPMPPMPAHREVVACWREDLPSQCLVLPVRIRDRLVSVIVCDPGPAGLVHVDFEAMNRLARHMGVALETCIARSKRLSS